MCQRLYIASTHLLPQLRSPHLVVAPMHEPSVRPWFSAEVVNVAEARGHVECGCGFPVINERRPDQAVLREDAETVKALATYLTGLAKRKYIAELVLSYVGLEPEAPTNWREVSLADLLAPGFRFRTDEGLRVRPHP